jgi:acyl carrier protein
VDVETTLRKFIQDTFGPRLGEKSLRDDDSLLDAGVIDSVGIFELVGFLQGTFGITIDDTEIVPEHFESVNTLAAFVRGKQASRADAV